MEKKRKNETINLIINPILCERRIESKFIAITSVFGRTACRLTVPIVVLLEEKL